MNINKMKINRFYVAADKIAAPIFNGQNDFWTKATIEQAIQHGKDLLAERPHIQGVAIVEITHIIMREDIPVRVLKLKR